MATNSDPRESPSVSSDEEEVPLERPESWLQGAWRRNRTLIVAVVLALAAGPALTRLLRSYRAVVLEVQGQKTLIARKRVAPAWMKGVVGPAGTIVGKETGAWNLRPSAVQAGDEPLLELYKRYTQTYQGRITRIDPPLRPGGASVAVVELDDGSTIRIALWADHLATAIVGARVRKSPSAWDPVLVDEKTAASPQEEGTQAR